MHLDRILLPMLALILLLPACTEPASSEAKARPHRNYDEADLREIVIQPGEAPEGTELVEAASGPFSLERLWSPACCPTQHAEFEESGFRAAFANVFEQPGRSDDPVDTRPGYEMVSSSAVLFWTPEGASEAFHSWVEYHRDPGLDRLQGNGLGDETVAFTGSPNAPAEVLFYYFWRKERLLLGLRVSAGRGTIDAADVRPLVDLMDRRAS